MNPMRLVTRLALSATVCFSFPSDALAQPEAIGVVGDLVNVFRSGQAPIAISGSDEVLARDELVGAWQCTYFERSGRSRPEIASGIIFEFTRGRLEITQAGRSPTVMRYDVDLQNYPHPFSWTLPHVPHRQSGVYHSQDDVLWICVGAPNRYYTTKFLTQPGDGRTLYKLERIRRNPLTSDPSDPQWTPQGSYLLSPSAATEQALILQLATNHQGSIIGEAIGHATNTRRPLEGMINRRSRRVTIWIGTDRSTEVAIDLDSFGVGSGAASVQRAKDKPAEDWTISYLPASN